MAKSPVIFSDAAGDAAPNRDQDHGTDNARDVFADRLTFSRRQTLRVMPGDSYAERRRSA